MDSQEVIDEIKRLREDLDALTLEVRAFRNTRGANESRIMAALQTGRMTTGELAAKLGARTPSIHAACKSLQYKGLLTSGRVPNTAGNHIWWELAQP